MFIVDSHLDLAMNALFWNRDLKRTVAEIREKEAGMTQKGRACNTVSFPEMRKAEVGISFCTMLARVERPDSPATGYRDHDIAFASAQGELAYYRQLERQGDIELLYTASDVNACAERWLNRKEGDPYPKLGMLLTMEGADPVVNPEQVHLWWNEGLRVLSLVHYGVSKYAHGTGTSGPLSADGRELLREMDKTKMLLDVTHMSDMSFFEAMDFFTGRILATHNNCRELCPGDRQFSDDQLKILIERDAVIGIALDAWMIAPNWIKGETRAEDVGCNMEMLCNNIDYIAQKAGSVRNVGIGTDLDGGYGREQVPYDLETIVDLQKIKGIMEARGYSQSDIEAVFHGNWLRFLNETLPK